MRIKQIKYTSINILLIITWSLLIAFFIFSESRSYKSHIENVAIQTARAYYERDLSFRMWAASHGGVYVPIDSITPPNPYLKNVKEKNIVTDSGQHLTLMNPAYITRQLYENFTNEGFMVGNITRLNPVNPNNEPTEWEREALLSFNEGLKEKYEIYTVNDTSYIKFMKPLYVVQSCLHCHADLNYNIGDIGGGISISAPINRFIAPEKESFNKARLEFILIWLVGLFSLQIAIYYLKSRYKKQKAAEFEALESNQRYKNMANLTFEGILVHKNGIVIDMNAPLQQMLGYPLKDLKDKNCVEIIVAYPFRKIVYNKINSSKTPPYEIEIVRKDGSQFHAELESKVVEVNGEKSQITAIRDITSRKLSSIKLFKAQQNLRFHIEQTPLGVIEWNTRFEVVNWNRAAEEIFGYTYKEVKGRNSEFLLTEQTKTKVEDIWNELLQNLDGNQSTNENVTKNGKIIICEWYNTPLVNENGQIVGVASMVQNVTEREHSRKLLQKKNDDYEALNEELRERNEQLQSAEEELTASNDELRNLLDDLYEHEHKLSEAEKIANIGHWEFYLSDNKVKASDGAKKIYGVPLNKELTIDEAQQIPIPEHRPLLDETLKKLITKNGIYDIEFKIKRANDGMIRFIHSKAEYIKERNVVFGVIQDITNAKIQEQVLKTKFEELHLAEQKLKISNTELSDTNKKLQEYTDKLEAARLKAEESDRLKSTFLANMSHEIRTPMNAIIGFTQLLVSSSISEEKREEFTQIIISSGEQLLSLVNDILDISRIETGQLKLVKKDVNITKLLNSLYSVFNIKASVKNLCLELNNTEKELIIYSDETRLRQILSNLITNAIKYTEKGKVQFGYNIANNNIQFYVEDTGIGIDKNHIDKIFDRFEQEERGVKIGSSGVGLGLSICKGLVGLLEGEIWVESKINKGSKFCFSVPAKVVKKEKTKGKSVVYKPNDFKNRTILVAEDNLINFKVVEAQLEETGATLIHAENGRIAVELIKSNTAIDVVLMDIRMPEMDGYEAARLIKGMNSKLPIVAQTAYALDNEKDEILKANFDYYLSKPIKKDLLFEVIHKIGSKATVKT